MAIAGATALAQWLRSRGLAHRALFDTANYVLSAGAAGVVFDALAGSSAGGSARLAAALVAGLAYTVVNHVLLCAAMALSESRRRLRSGAIASRGPAFTFSPSARSACWRRLRTPSSEP